MIPDGSAMKHSLYSERNQVLQPAGFFFQLVKKQEGADKGRLFLTPAFPISHYKERQVIKSTVAAAAAAAAIKSVYLEMPSH
ncbi:hypothetical protein AKJ16_DCAP23440 [Drosera capensis]